ncbi:MAG: vitamin K epoxide reductase family protein [Solirubrobacterales bacterium]
MESRALRKPSERTLRIIAGLIALVGLGIASYIMVEQIQDKIPTCGLDGGCATVLNSQYAELLGVPLYYFGVLGYVSIFATTLISGDRGRLLGFVLSFFGFGMSVYLTFLQYVVIDSICVWCRGSAIAMTLLFIVCLTRLLMYYGTDIDAHSDALADQPETDGSTSITDTPENPLR